MKTKYFMRGLGTGLIVATLILCLIYAYKMSDTQIISRAKELGMVYEKNQDSGIQLEEKEEKASDNNSEEEPSGEETSDKENQKEDDTVLSEKETTTVAATETKESETTGVKQEETTTQSLYATIVIDGGMNSVEVSEKLQSLGVISDAKEFDYYLMKNGYSKNLQPGEHRLLKGANYEELAYILTK